MDRIRRRKQIKNTTSKEQEKEEKKFKKTISPEEVLN